MKILIASNQPVLAAGLKAAMTSAGLEVCAECGDVTELAGSFLRCQPDSAIIDRKLLPALDIIADVQRLSPNCQIVVWDGGMPEYERSQCKLLGARAIIPSVTPVAQVVEAVNLISTFHARGHSQTWRLAQELSPLERRIFELVGYGMSDEEISRAVHYDLPAVGKIIKQLARKFDAQNRCELALYGVSVLSDAPPISTGENESWKSEIAIG